MTQVLEKVEQIPPLPAAVQRIIELTQDIEADEQEIIQVITMDEALTGRILHVANSAFYGFSQRIGTVSQAVMVLGLRGLRNLTLAIAAMQFNFGKPKDDVFGVDRAEFWRHSVAVATISNELSKMLRYGEADETFVGGLLHDIGKVVLLGFFEDEYVQVLNKAAQSEKPLYEFEREAFGVDHAGVGRDLCRHWNIPPILTRMVAQHHLPQQIKGNPTEEDRRIFLVRASDNIARWLRVGADGEPCVELDFLKLTQNNQLHQEELNQFLVELPEQIDKAESLFELPGNPELAELRRHKTKVGGIVLADEREAAVAGMGFVTMGHSLVPVGEVNAKTADWAGVVADETLQPELRAILDERKVPILDFMGWRESQIQKGQRVHVRNLHAWLKEHLA